MLIYGIFKISRLLRSFPSLSCAIQKRNKGKQMWYFIADSVPIISVVISTFTTAAFAVTSLAAGLLTVSTASLQSFGALANPLPSYITCDPSRNLFVRCSTHFMILIDELLACNGCIFLTCHDSN